MDYKFLKIKKRIFYRINYEQRTKILQGIAECIYRSQD